MKHRIGFIVNNFTFRGTEVALYDYAFYNQTLLKNKSFIFSPKVHNIVQNEDVVNKFMKAFNIIYLYVSKEDLERLCQEHKIDAVYQILSGNNNDEIILKRVKNLIHCVYFMTEKKGDVYAGISESVANTAPEGQKYEWVPHIIKLLPSDGKTFRKQLNIPESAIIFGRHGAIDTFNIDYVKDVILKVLNVRKDIYFIFAVRPVVFNDIEHPQIKFIEAFTDDRIKRRFIDTCDAGIHCSNYGESFGIAVLEFSFCNKPVITWKGGWWHKQHLINLGDKAILYNNENELYNILVNFKKEYYQGKNLNVTQAFTPENVMEKFKKVFLDSVLLEK